MLDVILTVGEVDREDYEPALIGNDVTSRANFPTMLVKITLGTWRRMIYDRVIATVTRGSVFQKAKLRAEVNDIFREALGFNYESIVGVVINPSSVFNLVDSQPPTSGELTEDEEEEELGIDEKEVFAVCDFLFDTEVDYREVRHR